MLTILCFPFTTHDLWKLHTRQVPRPSNCRDRKSRADANEHRSGTRSCFEVVYPFRKSRIVCSVFVCSHSCLDKQQATRSKREQTRGKRQLTCLFNRSFLFLLKREVVTARMAHMLSGLWSSFRKLKSITFPPNRIYRARTLF